MWRSSAGVFLVLVFALPIHAEVCLPKLFEGGTRLHRGEDTSLAWLEIALRQHEACWAHRQSDRRLRIFAFGSSGIYGFPERTERSAIGLLNEQFDRDGVPAHVYNMGWVYTYQTKDALILREALRYEPDVIVYAVTLADLIHKAPIEHSGISQVFLANRGEVAEFAREQPPGLSEPLSSWSRSKQMRVWPDAAWSGLRQIGQLLHDAAASVARRIRRSWFPGFVEPPTELLFEPNDYDCREVSAAWESSYQDWESWSLLPYLEKLRAETGIEIVVVNWPVRPNPKGRCFNRRYLARSFEEYNGWLRDQVEARGLTYLDLHDSVPARGFVDTLHLNVPGQRRIARALDHALRPLALRSGVR